MFLFVIIFLVLLIVSVRQSPKYSLKREKFDESLKELNFATRAKFVCGFISIVIAIIPIVDVLLPKVEQGDYYKYFESPILQQDYSEDMPLFCVITAWIVLLGWLVWMASKIGYKEQNRKIIDDRITEQEEKDAYLAAVRRAEKKENENQYAALTSLYGNPEKIINISNDKIADAFILFPSSACIVYRSKAFPYSELISSEIKDNAYTTTTGSKHEITTSSNGSTIGRAVVGGLIAGPAGAIIGGTTSKKETEVIDNTHSETHHHYFVVVNLTTAANPMLKIDCGSSANKAEEINAIIVGIIASQAKPTSGSPSIADELEKLAALKEKGILTEAEFLAQKTKLLG